MNTSSSANLLGALALTVSDAVRDVTSQALSHGGETPAALIALGHVPGLTNDQLSHALGLSHAGTVRTVDRLVAAGLLERRPVPRDGRAVALHLTPRGVAERTAMLDARARVLERVLEPLCPAERDQLDQLLRRLIAGLVRDPLQGLSICRLCDEASCPACPVDAALGRPSGPP